MPHISVVTPSTVAGLRKSLSSHRPFSRSKITRRPVSAPHRDEALDTGALRPAEEQIGAAPAQAVLPFDAAASVDDLRQEGLQQQLWSGFGGIEPFQPMLLLQTEEGLDVGPQQVQGQAALRIGLARRL